MNETPEIQAEDPGIDSSLRAVQHRSDGEKRCSAHGNRIDERFGANVQVTVCEARERVGGGILAWLCVLSDHACAHCDVG